MTGTEYTFDIPNKAVYKTQSGKFVKFNGKWTGVNITDTYIEVRNEKIRMLLKKYSVK